MPRKKVDRPYCVIGLEIGHHARTWLSSEKDAIRHAQSLLNQCGNRDMTFAVVRLVAKAHRGLPPVQLELFR